MAQEKKKNKAQIKREETAQKQAFLENTFKALLMALFESTKDNRQKIKVGINYQNYNRYIKCSTYAQSVEFKIFGDGNVVVHMEEFCHNPYDEQIFTYISDTEAQSTFLASFEKLAADIIKEFLDKGCLGWHAYMDYVEDHRNAAKALEIMYKEYAGEPADSEEAAHESE